jgi:hypothetical protein
MRGEGKQFWRCSIVYPRGQTVPTVARWKMRVTTTYNGVDEAVEKKRSIFVFYGPISIYSPLILGSLFHNYRIWTWAGHALCESLHKPRPADLLLEIPSVPRRAKSSLHVPAPKLAYRPITYILAPSTRRARLQGRKTDAPIISFGYANLQWRPLSPVSVLPRFRQARFSHDPIRRPRRFSRRHL